MTSQAKTFLLMLLLSVLVVSMGAAIGGRTGLILALGFAILLNFGS